MRQSLFKSTVALFSGLAVFVMTAAPATLHQARAANTSRTTTQQPVNQFGTFVRELQPYVERLSDGTLALAAPRSVTVKLNQRWLAETQQGMAKLNDLVRQGVLTTTPGLTYVPRSQTGAVYTIQDGWTGYNCYWWGCTIHLSHYALSNYILPAWNYGGGAITTALAALSLPAWIVGGLVLIGSAGLWICDATGGWRGVIVYDPNFAPPYCTRQ
jgi:hypothetical protein